MRPRRPFLHGVVYGPLALYVSVRPEVPLAAHYIEDLCGAGTLLSFVASDRWGVDKGIRAVTQRRRAYWR